MGFHDEGYLLLRLALPFLPTAELSKGGRLINKGRPYDAVQIGHEDHEGRHDPISASFGACYFCYNSLHNSIHAADAPHAPRSFFLGPLGRPWASDAFALKVRG